jgi:hypothetical protein
MNFPNIPIIPPIRIPTDIEMIQPTQHQEKRSHFRMVYTSFLMTVLKLRKYQSVSLMTKRTLERIRWAICSLKQKHAVSIEFLRTYPLPSNILNPLIIVVQELHDLSLMIETKFIVNDLIDEIEWSDYE